MVSSAGGSVSRLRLVKLLFLLRHESELPPSKSYDFLPYLHGPFSFTLYRDLNMLSRQQLLHEPRRNTWSLTEGGRVEAGRLDVASCREVDRIAARYCSRTTPDLLNYIYSEYEWSATRSKKCRETSKPATSKPTTVYTIGCGGTTVDGLIRTLIINQVERVVDVRSNPVSRVFGFHKSRLQHLLRKASISYEHHPGLGIAQDDRFGTESPPARRRLLDRYAETTLAQEHAEVVEIAESSKSSHTALLCQERDPEVCHRSRLADCIGSLSSLSVRHLRP